jgi:23S rRNA (cytidine2498-2'-O)-methyltransferase
MMRMEILEATGYLAAEGFEEDLGREFGGEFERYDRLFVSGGGPRGAAWAQNIWYEPALVEIGSISEGIRALRAIQRNWVLYPFAARGRAGLIRDGLPKVSAKPLVFGAPVPSGQLGSWTLLDEHTMLASARCSSPFAHGEAHFVEDKFGPPNRAYLKLWEALTLAGKMPGPGERCLDLGGSPGGWAWVLAGLGARVVSVDKAPLDPAVSGLPNVEYQAGSAFAIEPAKFGPVDWLFSDVICYPERLFGLVERWLAAGACKNFICTLKFQGPTDFAAMEQFRSIPGSRLLHLYHNKHELTWMHLAQAQPA